MPFTFRPVQGNQLVDRKDLIDEITGTLCNFDFDMGFAIYGKRRLGKTSLFLEVCQKISRSENIIPVYFSMWELVEQTVEEFTKLFTTNILDSYNKRLSLLVKAKNLIRVPVETVKDILSKMKISAKLKEDIEIILSKEFDKRKVVQQIERVFLLPELLAKETKTRCVIFIDEFPSIMDLKNGTRIGEGIVRKIRTINERYKNVILCISGSIRKTMETVCLSHGSAFYKQFLVREVKPLEDNYIKEIIRKNLLREITPDAFSLILHFCGGVPFYAHAIGYRLQKAGQQKIDSLDVKSAVKLFLEEDGHLFFKEEFEKHSAKERKILVLMATERLSSPSKIAKSMKESTNMISQYLDYLENKATVERVARGVYEIADKVFNRWLVYKYKG